MGRIAKFLASAGICSRRQAERLIAEGRISVNGEVTNNLGLVLTGDEEVRFDGKLVTKPESPPRLWEFHKPQACIVSEKDERGRKTIFDKIADLKKPDLPRLIAVGRLDYNSEGLLLLTDNGALARLLELPDSDIERHYRVRVFGTPRARDLQKLQQGMQLENIRYRPLQVKLSNERGGGEKGKNSWLEVVLKEGKNREIRKLFEALGYPVNRLIRTGFGEFSLARLGKGELREVPQSLLRRRLKNVAKTRAFFA